MFRGRYEHTIDPKGRVSLPVKFRDILNERYDDRLVITNFDSCLAAYPYDEWTLLEEKVSSLSMLNKDVKSFLRFFISGAAECSIDKQGRILIPPVLREYAKLEKDIVFAGVIKKIEIWSKDRWEQAFAIAKDDFDKVSKNLEGWDLGI
ncbi:MAG: division/cell wall cluster transcriptional repressor MraZ [Thermodesulfobacteriota bacterium]|nr:division/cell wall cluster transcriptional repressor MraZ [Thermodesulfobacteriota bacterium]